ncbi:MAG: ABC transporter permease, partial [Candidatus Eisenbacteria bacterium]
VVPNGYAEARMKTVAAEVQLLIDGADAATAATVENYLTAILARVDGEAWPPGGASAGPHRGAFAQARTRILFNPELESSHFIVPGLVAIILIMICALLTSIAITREKETGTLEQVLATPVRPVQLVLGKVVPYLFIAAADAVLVLAVGRIVFHVPMRGSWWALAGYSFVYLSIALGLGLLISTLARTQRVAMTMALVATMLPTIILSGFVFPLASMPSALQAIGHLIPATYYLPVIRGIMLTGRAWYPIEGGVMTGMAVLVLALAVRRFGTRIEA